MFTREKDLSYWRRLLGMGACVVVGIAFAACIDDSSSNTSDSGGDADTDSDAGGNTDTGVDPATMCDNYPASDDNFSTGSVVTNYTFLDKNDEEIRICYFAEQGYTSLLLKIGTGT